MSATSWALSAFVAAVLAFVFREVLIGGTGWFAHRTIVLAAKRLPKDRREFRREEWLAEYDAIVARGLHVRGVIYACGTYMGAVRMARSQKGSPSLIRMVSASRELAASLSFLVVSAVAAFDVCTTFLIALFVHTVLLTSIAWLLCVVSAGAYLRLSWLKFQKNRRFKKPMPIRKQ